MYVRGRDFQARGGAGGRFAYRGLSQEFHNLTLNLVGRHQYGNSALALAAVELLNRAGLAVPETAIREGLNQTRWPGRLEVVPQDPRVLLDGAHNPAAARILAETLKQTRGNGRLILVLGIMADKDVDTVLARLLPLAQTVVFTRPQYFRAADVEDLAARARPFNLEIIKVPQVSGAIRRAQDLAGPRDRIVVSGSLYTVGEAKEYFEGIVGEGAKV
jgi:dihydrofolate synthase/folylpolyglutamate synthase